MPGVEVLVALHHDCGLFSEGRADRTMANAAFGPEAADDQLDRGRDALTNRAVVHIERDTIGLRHPYASQLFVPSAHVALGNGN